MAVAIALAGLGEATGVLAADAVERGEAVFQKCYACHSVVPGETGLTGPNPAGVVGRPVAGAPGLAHAEALEALPTRAWRVWTNGAVDAFLTSLEDFAPGTAITLVGLPDAKERADLITYLATTLNDPGRE